MKSATDIQAELQAALDQEGADETTHAAALTQAITDLEALAAASTGAADPVVSAVVTLASGATVDLAVPATA